MKSIRRMKGIKGYGRSHFKYIAVTVGFILILAGFFGRIIYLGVTAPEKPNEEKIIARTLTVKAVRGEIYDRNGKRLVSNDYSYNIYLNGSSFPSSNGEINQALEKAAKIIGEDLITDGFPLTSSDEGVAYKEFDTDSSEYSALIKMLGRYNLPRDTEPSELFDYLASRYALCDGNGKPTVQKELVMTVMAIRYECERRDFSAYNSVTVAKDIDTALLTAIEEADIKGIEIEKTAERVYNYPGYASHILGRTGKIQSDDLEYYTEKGYAMNAIVGIDGVEEAFEDYLRGIDGTLVIIEDTNGNIIDEYYKKEPVAGKDVYLTIDIELQITAEDALAYNIRLIKEEAEKKIADAIKKATDKDGNVDPNAKIPQYIGEDVTAGAATLMNPNNGELYAIASYPTYDLSTYTEDYNDLLNAPNSPLFNRALMGTYEPGSTFKVGVAAAALEHGVINANTTIFDSGVYKYYDDFQPECWVYTDHGYGHGNVNVITAIQHSCNYFFYDVGRLLTIEKLNTYCKGLGLGVLTGIELPEARGILAGPEYRASINRDWLPGDTIQASIGQSDNTFTPLQIGTYLSTIINGGTRYKTHILLDVCEYGETPDTTPKTTVLNTVQLSEENLELLKIGMKNVMENGTAAPVFADYPMEIGGKTGTAQVGKTRSNNGIFTAFAPYDEPEIVATCVVEQAGGSNEIGITLRRMFNKYFGINE